MKKSDLTENQLDIDRLFKQSEYLNNLGINGTYEFSAVSRIFSFDDEKFIKQLKEIDADKFDKLKILHLQIVDLKSILRDINIISNNISFLIKNSLKDSAILYETIFKDAVITFMSFFTESKMSYKPGYKDIFKDDYLATYLAIKNLRDTVFAHRGISSNNHVGYAITLDGKFAIDSFMSEKYNFYYCGLLNRKSILPIFQDLINNLEEYIKKALQKKVGFMESIVNENQDLLSIFSNLE